jgi:hypothetical protein
LKRKVGKKSNKERIDGNKEILKTKRAKKLQQVGS